MAVDGIIESLPGCVAAEDLSGALYRFVKIAAAPAGQPGYGVALCDTLDEAVLGVAYTNPTQGAVRVATSGVLKVIAGAGGVAVGDTVGTDANGAAVVTATAAAVVGIALKAAAAGAVAEIFVR